MHNFKDIISDYMKNVFNINDKRIMKEAIDILDSEPVLDEKELEILKRIFMALKEDYTISITKDIDTLDFMIVIKKQDIPIIENKHDLNTLYNELNRISNEQNISNTENTVLIFLDACEHIEENEIYMINKMIELLNNSWTLIPHETNDSNDNLICYHFVPEYQKILLK